MHEGDILSLSAGQGDDGLFLWAPGNNACSNKESKSRYQMVMNLRGPIRIRIAGYGIIESTEGELEIFGAWKIVKDSYDSL